MPEKYKVSVIIPAYNEEKALAKVVKEIPSSVDEIIVVDDGSSDKTYEIAKGLGVKVFRHEKNKGKVAAIHTGIQNAKGDIIILTDADFTYPAKYISTFLDELDRGCDLVIGSRFLGQITNMPILNKLGNKVLSMVATYVSGTRITDGQSGFRAFKKDFFEKINVSAKGLEFETEMTVKAAKHGYKVVEIPIKYRERIGKSKLHPLKDGYKMFFALLSILYNETSILSKTILFPALVLNLMGVMFGVVSLIEYLTTGRPQHPYYPLLTVLFAILGIQLFSLGLIIDNITKKMDRIYETLVRKK